MGDHLFQHCIILTGPTASGKSDLAIELALEFGAEIVSMDSMALYRRMDIGTAKPTVEQRRIVPHHLIDVLEPWESASVAWWLEGARRCVEEIEARGNRALIVGGTPLYLKVLLRGLFPGPPANDEIRCRLREQGRVHGYGHLHERLRQVDPAAAERLHPQDLRRVIRALEVWELTGKPISDWQKQWNMPRDVETAVPPVFCLTLPREELYARIDRRVESMFAEGLVREVEGLRRLGRPLSKEAAQALGYKEVLSHLENRLSLPGAIRAVQTRSRNFAKRQLTWFRNLPECRWIGRELTFAELRLTIHEAARQ
jgi:tRNA dimethylallyltransferase